MFFLALARGYSRRSKAPAPLFWKRKATTSSAPTPSSTMTASIRAPVPYLMATASESFPSSAVETSAPQLFCLIGEDDGPFHCDRDLVPRKRRSIDVGGGVTRAIDLREGDFFSPQDNDHSHQR